MVFTQLRTVGIRALTLAVAGGGGAAGGAADPAGDPGELLIASEEAAITATGDPLPGISATDFATAKGAFATVEAITDGLGPVFNEKACCNCHTQGSIGGAGVQIERRFGRFDNGLFNSLNRGGGSLRQLFSIGSFTGANGQHCTVPVEAEPAEATVHNVGRLTTPLFGLGLVDAMPDSFFQNLASNEPSPIRGRVN